MKKGKSKLVDIDSIRPRPEGQMRFETLTDEAIAEKAASMKAVGQLQPCLVEKNGFIVGGEIRWRAGKLLGWKEIEVQVVSFKDEFERLSIQLAENEQTTPPSQLELAEMYGHMYKVFLKTWEKPAGVSTRRNKGIMDMAKAVGVTPQTMGIYLQVANDDRITPELYTLAKRGRLNNNVIIQLARFPVAIRDRCVERLLAAVDEGIVLGQSVRPFSEGLAPLLRRRPELIEAALDVFLLTGLTEYDKVERLKALRKEEKTGADYMTTFHGQVKGVRKFLASAAYSPENVRLEYQPGIKSDLVSLSRDIGTYLFEEEESND